MKTKLKLPVPEKDFWVFAYGSLMWRPGFTFAENRAARIYGYHRHLCVWSWRYRGTVDKPGLVFGLMRGGSCVGRAFRVAAHDTEVTVDYLHEREMVGDVYRPCLRPVRLDNGRRVEALAFVVKNNHRQYAGKQPAHIAADIIKGAHGPQGSNVEYVMETASQLDTMGVHDAALAQISRMICAPAPRATL